MKHALLAWILLSVLPFPPQHFGQSAPPVARDSASEPFKVFHAYRMPRISVYLYSCSFNAHAGNYPALALSMRQQGIVRVRLSTSAKTFELDPAYVSRIKSFNRAMHAQGIEVSALYLQDALFLHSPTKVSLRTNQMVQFNTGFYGGVLANEKFDSLDVDVEAVQDPLWSGASWATRDLLIQDLLFNVVAVIRSELDALLGASANELPFSVGIQHYLHDRVLSGDLTFGKVQDFLAAGANVVSLFDYDDDLDDLVSRAAAEVMETNVPNCIEIVLKSTNDAYPGQSFFQEGCLQLRSTGFVMMNQLRALNPIPNLVPQVSLYEYDSLQELCLSGSSICGP